MTRLTHCVVFLAVGLALAFVSSASANMLLNGDFEDTTPPSTGLTAPYWPEFQYTSTSELSTASPHSGAQHVLQSGGTDQAGGGSTGCYQQVNGIVAGQEYVFKAWAKVDELPVQTAVPGEGINMRLIWEDGTGADQRVDIWPIWDQVTLDYQQFVQTAVAPAGATQVKVCLYRRIISVGTYWDDAEFSAVPEPASLGLVLLGGLGLLGMRRFRWE